MTTEPIENFTNALLTQDAASNPTSDELKRELKLMMVRELPQITRFLMYGLSIVLVFTGVMIGSLIVSEPLPILAQFGLSLGVVFSAAWSWKVFRIARAGKIHLKRDNRRIANMVWIFTLLMSMLMLMAAGFKEDLSDRKLILITGQALFFLLTAATYLVVQRLEEAELSARERMLRMELRWAETEANAESLP